MSQQHSTQQIQTILINTFQRKLMAIYLFGSWGTEYESRQSDIDIAVLLKHGEQPIELWKIALDIAAVLNRDVDLLDLRKSSTVMKMQIVFHGKRIYCSDFTGCEQFEDFVFSSYARLNEERKGIISDIQQRGSIYG